jgi:hypothetical protein
MNTVVLAIVRCLEKHHGNDKEKFLQKWPLTSGLTTRWYLRS